jgi:hypothetical protein
VGHGYDGASSDGFEETLELSLYTIIRTAQCEKAAHRTAINGSCPSENI